MADNRCLVSNCQNRLEHWTREHYCQKCCNTGHSDFECGDKEELRILLYTIIIRQKYLDDCYQQSSLNSNSSDSSITSHSSRRDSGDEYTPLLKAHVR